MAHINLTKAEKETVARWDAKDRKAFLYTTDPATRRRWLEAGYQVKDAGTVNGIPKSWEAEVPADRISFRALTRCRRAPRERLPNGRFASKTPTGVAHSATGNTNATDSTALNNGEGV